MLRIFVKIKLIRLTYSHCPTFSIIFESLNWIANTRDPLPIQSFQFTRYFFRFDGQPKCEFQTSKSQSDRSINPSEAGFCSAAMKSSYCNLFADYPHLDEVESSFFASSSLMLFDARRHYIAPSSSLNFTLVGLVSIWTGRPLDSANSIKLNQRLL